MSAPAPALRRLLRVLPLVLVLAAAPVLAEPPGRVARVNHVEGSVSLAPAGDDEWTEAPRNRPLTRGDRLWTDRGSRAEVQVGSSALRLDGRSRVDILALDDRSTQLSLTQGALYVRVRSLPEGENFEVDTPNLAWRAAWPGDYRIDVDPAGGTTRVTIHSGTGAVYGESGQAQPLGGGQQITFRGRTLSPLAVQESPPLDGFDRWAQARNRREDQSIAARHVPREVVGYQDLDPHGQWRSDPAHGPVWLPQGMPADWAPYRHGYWDWIAPWGWSWIDDAPWGFAPFHYGRWTVFEGQWAWAPGRLDVRPPYAPALVAFLGGGGGGVSWFPLAPGEAWQPPYRTSPAYLDRINREVAALRDGVHAHQRSPRALTSIAASDFQRGRPAAAGWLRVAAQLLANAQVVAPPPMPDRTALAQARASRTPVQAPAVVRPVAAPTQRPATPPVAAWPAPAPLAKAMPPQPQPAAVRVAAPAAAGNAPEATVPTRAAAAPAPRQPTAPNAAVAKDTVRGVPGAAPRQPIADRGTRASAAAVPPSVRAPATMPARARAGDARRAVKSAAPARQVVKAESARERAAREVEAKRALVARQDAARREKSRAASARRAELAQRQEQSRREAVARRDEEVRRRAHARQVEASRRAAERDAQALDEQRLRREQQARRAEQDREQAERAAWQRAQQATTEQWRREHEALEQRRRPRGRPDLRSEPRPEPAYRAPDVWQRGIPLLAPGRTS